MADFHTPASDVFPPQHQHERTGSMSLGPTPTNPAPPSDNGGAAIDITSNAKQSFDGDAVPPPQNGNGNGNVHGNSSGNGHVSQPGVSPEQLKLVSDVLSSELGIMTLLNRLKASIASAKEFAAFLKKRAFLEDEHAQGLRKLSRLTQESMRRPEYRQGTFTIAYDEMMHTHERMAENGTQFAQSLHQMHEDLNELANVAERSRKHWKTNGLTAEQKVADMEQTMRKSKSKYDSLADDYERAKMGESRQSGKMFGLKGHKSAAQHEGDLLKKVQAADQTYHAHVQALQTEKTQLLANIRPEAVKSLQDLIRETDAGVTMQMQKFASFNEKLLLSNGLSISPIQGLGGENSSQPRSLRQAVASINNDKDLYDFIGSQHRNIGPNAGEVKYERNPVLPPQGPAMSHPTSGTLPQPMLGSGPPPGQYPVQQPLGPGSRSSTLGLGPLTGPQSGPQSGPPGPPGPPGLPPMDGNFSQGGPIDQNPFPQPPQHQSQPPQPPQHNRTYSQGNALQGAPVAPSQQHHPPRYGNGASISSSGPPQLGALPFQGGQPSTQPLQPLQPLQASPPDAAPPYQAPHERSGSTTGLGQGPSSGGRPPFYNNQAQGPSPGPMSAPSKPVFGMPLNKLYERDGLAVPMVVYQCIQAVDMFGLGVQGIYRQSGSMNHIQKLKNMFDTESSSPALDFRNPENFYHDVNSVTGLLKQFFRDLPDPLLTGEHHDSFIAAAKHEDDTVRRDSLHAIINSLPDPNYATLRALTLHLYRIMDNSHVNRMNSHNLAVIFGPTLMGTDPSTAIADAGWQIKVIDTILQNTFQIFDED